jgi:CRP/FNR family transcriptional regulator, dissimilatory nitrate respiration regulator
MEPGFHPVRGRTAESDSQLRLPTLTPTLNLVTDLPGIELFRELGPSALRLVATRGVERRFTRGTRIFSRGTEPRGLMIVLSGRVRVVRESEGRGQVVHEEGVGGTLGEVPLFAGGGYPASAIAIESTRCLVLTREVVLAIVREDPRFALALLERLARRVRALVDRLDRLASHRVDARLAAFLLGRLATSRGTTFQLGMTQSELAEELGTVREVVVRELGRLRRRGVIRTHRDGRFVVLDAAALEGIVRRQ